MKSAVVKNDNVIVFWSPPPQGDQSTWSATEHSQAGRKSVLKDNWQLRYLPNLGLNPAWPLERQQTPPCILWECVHILEREGCGWSRCGNVITVPNLGRAASDKLHRIDERCRGGSSYFCLSDHMRCRVWLHTYTLTFVYVWECVCPGVKGVKTTLDADCSL